MIGKKIKKFIDHIYSEVSQIEGLLDLAINPDTDIGTEYRIRVKEDVLAKLGLDFRAVGSCPENSFRRRCFNRDYRKK